MATTVADLDKAIARWNTRLKRAVNTIDKLQKRRKRLVIKAERDLTIAPPLAKAVKVMPMRSLMEPAAPPPEIDTGIPDFLKRDKAAAAEVAAEQAETKRRKAAGRIAKMKAKQSGETKRMPLTGKAALEAIRNG